MAARYDQAFRTGRKERHVALRALGSVHAVIGAVQDDRRDGDRRPLGQAMLDRIETRVARRIAVAMPVGVNDDVDEIRIVE